MKVNAAACRDTGTGRSFPICALSREMKLVTSVYSVFEGAKESPRNRIGEQLAFKSSFQARRIPNWGKGRAGPMLIGMTHQGGLQLSVESLYKEIGDGMPCSRMG